jgi:hypothetical protein
MVASIRTSLYFIFSININESKNGMVIDRDLGTNNILEFSRHAYRLSRTSQTFLNSLLLSAPSSLLLLLLLLWESYA